MIVNKSVVTAEAATVVDPNVPGDIELFGRTFEVGFHKGGYACIAAGAAAASLDGQLRIQLHLREIMLHEQAPAPGFEGLPPDQCTNYLGYNIDVTMTTDDKTVLGTFAGEASHYLDGLYVDAKSPAQALSGTLGVRVTPARSSLNNVRTSFTLAKNGAAKGTLSAITEYTDCAMPLWDSGDSLFWPVGTQSCHWNDATPSPGSRLLTLNELQAR